jgi:hypothetical protein
MFFFRSLGLAILVSAMMFHGRATAASIIARLPSSVPQFQFVNGCGIGVHRGPYNDCLPIYPPVYRKRYVYPRGYYQGYREGYYQGDIVRLQPYASYYRTPYLFGRDCGLGYDISCFLGICWRRCW